MADPSTSGLVAKAVEVLWKNRKTIKKMFKGLRGWLAREKGGRVVILGPGGTGKDTLAKVLTSDDLPVMLDLTCYEESSDIEHYQLKRPKGKPVEIVVLPGQKHRRESTWAEFLQLISGGSIRGIIFVTAYGYHSIGNINIRSLKQWKGRKKNFLNAYLLDRQQEELLVLNELLPAIKNCNKKVWLLVITTKQDLWWIDREEVYEHYRSGAFKKRLENELRTKDPLNMRVEQVFCSLTIGSFKTGTGEVLHLNSEGYGLKEHGDSLKHLIQMLDSLRSWESR